VTIPSFGTKVFELMTLNIRFDHFDFDPYQLYYHVVGLLFHFHSSSFSDVLKIFSSSACLNASFLLK
jgi:hypothetical protein